jgi:hypothetical protein
MSTVTESPRPVKSSKPRPKPIRTLRVLDRGLIRITETSPSGKAKSDLYTVKRIPSEMGGHGFEVAKIVHADFVGVETDPAYHVHLAAAQDEADTCECLGHLHHNPKRGTICRHVAALKSLIAQGSI